MDHRLKELLQKAETWPQRAQDELIAAARAIEREVAARTSGKHQAVFRTLRAAEKVPLQEEKPIAEMSILEALMKAPKTGKLRAPKSVPVRYRPPIKF